MLTYLVLYAWHASTSWAAGFAAGGPLLVALPMPSAGACEAVGRAMKEMVDAAAPPSKEGGSVPAPSGPAVYRCVVVPAEAPRGR